MSAAAEQNYVLGTEWTNIGENERFCGEIAFELVH